MWHFLLHIFSNNRAIMGLKKKKFACGGQDLDSAIILPIAQTNLNAKFSQLFRSSLPSIPYWSQAQDVINSQKSKEKMNSCHSCARMGHLANKCPERKKHRRPSLPQTNTLPCAQAQSSTPASQTSVDHNVTELVRKALVKALQSSSRSDGSWFQSK